MCHRDFKRFILLSKLKNGAADVFDGNVFAEGLGGHSLHARESDIIKQGFSGIDFSGKPLKGVALKVKEFTCEDLPGPQKITFRSQLLFY